MMYDTSSTRAFRFNSMLVVAAAAMVAGGANGQSVVQWGRPGYMGTMPSGLDRIRQVSTGFQHASVLKFDGTLVSWGPNAGVACPPTTLTNVRAVDSGALSTIVLFQNGTVAVYDPLPTSQPPAGLGPCVAVKAGYGHYAAIRESGTFVVWPEGLDFPVQSSFGVSKFALGYSNIVVLRSDGTLVVGAYGGSAGQPQLYNIPADIYSSAIRDVDIYGYHAAVVRADGSVKCWGRNTELQCDVPPTLGPCKAVAAGFYHTVALRVDGTVQGWGRSDFGEAGGPPGTVTRFDGLSASEDISLGGVLLTDCNQDGTEDTEEIAASPWLDCNDNLILDVCSDTAPSGVPWKWIGVTGGSFQDSTNWCFAAPNAGPGSTSSIVFPYDRSYAVSVPVNRTIKNMQVSRGYPTMNLPGKTLTLAFSAQPSQAYLRVGTQAGVSASLGVIGGTISSSFTEVGQLSGSQGTLNVGPGGRVIGSQEVCVGCAGTGTMNVLNGGQVVTQKGVIGKTDGGPGTVLVQGIPANPQQGTAAIQSSWDSTLGIDVRNGTLTVGPEGVINSPAVGIVLYSGGVLQGTGRINGTVTNFGAAAGNCGASGLTDGVPTHRRGGLFPGGDMANLQSVQGEPTIGTLTINGVYQQIESNPLLGTNSGSLLIEVMPGANGPQHDKLVVNGTASLGGGLFVDFPSGDPGTFDSLPIVTASNVDPNRDMFDVAVMPGLPDGRFVKVDPVQSLKGGSAGISISVSTLNELLGFGDPSSSGVPRVPLAAAVADLDGKNGPDLAITTRGLTPLGPGSLFILFNDGNGGLEQAIQWPGLLGVEPVDIVAAQLRTNSSLIDLAVVNKGDNTLQYLENQGGGVFTSLGTTSTGLGSAPVAIAAASIYSPSNLAGAAKDLIVANSATNEVAVFKVLGNFPWSIPIFLPAPIEPTDVDGVDIDNNRTIDIIVSAKRSSLIKSFQFDSKTQTFDDGFEFLTGEGPASLVIADLDGDGRPDVTTVNNGQLSDSVSVLINRTAAGGLVNFAPAVNLPTGGDPVSVVAGDFDLDTQPGQAPDLDLAFTARATSAPNAPRVVKILRNDRQNGVLVLAPAEDQIVPGSPRIVLAAEMDPAPGVDLVTVADGGAAGVQLQGSVANAAVRPAVRRQKPCLPGDVNCDGTVDGNDLATLLAAWGTANAAADFNRDGIVSADDLAVLLANWGAGQS